MSLPAVERVYVTEDRIKEWKIGNPNFNPPNPVPMLRFIYELSLTVVRGELPVQKCKAALDSVEFLDKASNEDIGSIFADAVTQMALDLTLPGESRARLIKLAKWLVESTVVPLRLFQERCEEEFLWEAEMIKIKAADLKSKEVRVNTRSLYQQTKFNLLREESEGYAKLVTLLCRGSDASTQSASTATVGIIKSLIGHFDLDPNRVFDIVLECFELQPDNNVLLDLIPIFPKSHASQILGFKFQYYQRMEVNHPVPFRLYQLTALLVKEDFIDLDSIYAHLLPKDEEAFEIYSVFSAKRLDEANKIGKINLAARGKDLMDDEKQGDVTTDLFSALDAESEAVNERASELENNQTLGLLTGFLTVDDWCHAKILFDRLSHLNPVEHIQISKELFRLIERSISSAYELVQKIQFQSLGLPSDATSDSMETESELPVGRSFIDLPKELFEMVSCAGPYLYRDTLLLQKVCKVLKGYLLSALELVNAGNEGFNFETHTNGGRTPRLHLKEARLWIEEALGTCLLPSLQLVPANPAVGQEIWEVLCLLPYEARYRLYGEWEKDDERMPLVLVARQTARLDTRRILKRLAKENLKQLGRMVAKLAHANPMTVLRTIVHQIEAYKDMITPVVDAFKYLTQLEYDILEYVVIERLAQSGRSKLKDDGLNLSDWLQSLASFWGHLCKKYPSMELRGLFQYLVNQLKKGHGTELVLLQELVQQMANVQYTENLTEEQLDSMAGSDTLRYQATSSGITRNNKALVKSTNRLRDSLLPKDEPKLAIPLLLLVCQHRSLIVGNADAPYIKMVSEQFDRCHGTLLQYVDFLCSAVTPVTAYAQLIPSLDDLFHLYHLDPEVAFLIYRRTMRLFKCQSSSDIFWPLDEPEALRSSVEETDSCDELILDLSPSRKPIMWSELLNTVRSMLPSKAWNSLSPDLYITFWGLTLYDLYVPRSRYESEIAKQHGALRSLEEISDNSSSAIMKRKKEKERTQESLDRLTNELQKHEDHVASVHRRLAREKDRWLSSCPDTLKINMEFLQRCLFPRCTFSMPDAVYCAMFVHTLHSLGTPFFNTVNHIDVLICKTLQPMICCCTEYEVGRLGRFLYETLKMAYFWKSKESIYERDCGNKPGFAVYYRLPNSQRVTYGQFIKVHWKWSQRITKLLIQCLESTEYMEIRNALILLTKISGVFPVTRKTGINLEKRVAKIKSDEREDLKVLATGVAAALASRKPSWVSDEDFGMGYVDLKPAPSAGPKTSTGNLHSDNGSGAKDQILRKKAADGRLERNEITSLKSDPGQVKVKASVNGSTTQALIPSASALAGTTKSTENQKQVDELLSRTLDENVKKVDPRASVESEVEGKRPLPVGSLSKQSRQEIRKDDSKSGKAVGRAHTSSSTDKDITHPTTTSSVGPANGNTTPVTAKGSTNISDTHDSEAKAEGGALKSVPSPKLDNSAAASRSVSDKQQKRASPAADLDRVTKRRKGETESRDLEAEIRFSERERLANKHHQADLDKVGLDDQSIRRSADRPMDRSKDKGSERHERDLKERIERSDKSRGDDVVLERPRDKSLERYVRDRSIERGEDRASEKTRDERGRDDRSKVRYNESSIDKSHVDDRFHGQHLPPPPPLPAHVIPHSMSAGRREEDPDRRYEVARHPPRLSPRHDERERRRSEEYNFVLTDDAKRRREEDLRDRKREEREALLMKVEEREREKASLLKEEMDANAAKRRKLKREYIPEPGEYSPGAPTHPPLAMSQSYDRAERKGTMVHRPGYPEPMYDRDWEEEKPQRAEQKRRHRK